MLEAYTQNEMSVINGKFLKETFQNFKCDKDGRVIIEFPVRKRSEFLFYKDLIEYKYCLPMTVEGNLFYLSKYSSYKFIKLVMPHIKGVAKNSYYTSILEEIKNEKLTIYAAGAIEKAPDHGVGFRVNLKEKLRFTKTNIVDPTDFEYNRQVECSSLTEYGQKHSIGDYYKFVRNVVKGDIESVMSVDVVVANIDQYIGTGTPAETSVCVAMNKPVYGLVAEGFDIKSLRPWMLGTVTRFFPTIQSLREFIIYPE